jgi:hypothetical protein
LKLGVYIHYVEDEVQKFLYDMILTIIIMIIFDAALIQYLESHTESNNLDFNTWMYFMVITITTVGYGDITPGY